MNEWIAWANALIAVSLIGTGLVLFWQAWHREAFWEWPLSVLVTLGLTPFLVGLAWGQTVLFRLWDMPGAFGLNGEATAAFRWVVAVVVTLRLVRVARGRLLTPADRDRLNGGSR